MFEYKDTEGSGIGGIIMSDGKNGNVDISSNPYESYGNDESNAIKAIADSITFNLPSPITIDNITIEGT